MKKLILGIALCTLTVGGLLAERAPVAVYAPNMWISEGRTTVVEVGAAVTTIVFPFIVDDIHGVGFTTDPAKRPGDYILSRTAGGKMFSISATTGSKPAAERTMNVFAGDKVYTVLVRQTTGEAPPVVRLSLVGKWE